MTLHRNPLLGSLTVSPRPFKVSQCPMATFDIVTQIWQKPSYKDGACIPLILVRTLLKDSVPQQKVQPENIERIIEALTTGRVTHDYPITVEEATEIGLPVNVGLPHSIYQLMDLYPQPQGGRPTVQYIPMPYDDRRPLLPTPKDRPLEEPNQRT